MKPQGFKVSQMTAQANIIITGFMGTGKTTVGRETAQRMGREFIDTDHLIETLAGQSIVEIFAAHGERYFREQEAQVLQSVANKHDAVIATGGGTLLSEENLRLASQAGMIFCLETRLDILALRLTGSPSRPLLGEPDLPAAMTRLLAQRLAKYEQLPNHIDTTEFSPGETAAMIIKRYYHAVGFPGVAI